MDVIAIEDDWLVDRVRCALMDPQPPSKELGILHQVSDAPTVSGRELTKRFALIKLALFLIHRVPEVSQTCPPAPLPVSPNTFPPSEVGSLKSGSTVMWLALVPLSWLRAWQVSQPCVAADC